MKNSSAMLDRIENLIAFLLEGGSRRGGIENYMKSKIRQYAACPILVDHFTDELHRLRTRKI